MKKLFRQMVVLQLLKVNWDGPTMTSVSPNITGTHLAICQGIMSLAQLGSSSDSLTEILKSLQNL